jgi:hypothetical protein
VFVESSSSESSVVVDSEPDEDERAEQERLKPGAPVVPVLSVAKSHFTFAPSNLKAPGVSVLDKQLAQSKFVACDEYSIADMAIFPWMRGAESRGIDMNEYPNVKRWFDGIHARPAVQRALQVLSNESNSNPVDDKAREVMFGKTQFQKR